MTLLKDKLLRDTTAYSAANYIAMGIGILLSIATKAILGAVGAGVWAMVKVFCSYGEYSDLGTRNAMLREIPQSVGRGDTDRVERLQNSAFSFTALMALVSLSAMIMIAWIWVKDPVFKTALCIAGFLVVATQGYNFVLSYLRSTKRIGFLSRLIVFNIIGVAVLSVTGAWLGGVIGLVTGVLIATCLSATGAYVFSGLRIRIQVIAGEVRRLIQIGLPMVGISYVLVTFLSIDVLMITKLIGFEALGFYTIALMCVQQISTMGRYAQIVLLPHIQERYGRTQDLGSTRPFFIRTTQVLALVLPVLIGCVVFTVPLLVVWVLPEFTAGLGAMKILVTGYFFVAVNEMSGTILVTINRHARLLPILAGVVALAVVLNGVFIHQGLGIEGVAVATSITYFVYFITVFYYSFKNLLTTRELIRTTASIVLIFGYGALAVWGIDTFLESYLAKMAVFGLAMLPQLLYLERKEHILASLRKRVFSDERNSETVAAGGVR